MFGLFNSKEREDLLIPNPQSFCTRYKMISQNIFLMGEKNNPIEIKTEVILQVTQRVYNNFIETVITIDEIKGNTLDNNLKKHLDTIIALSNITKSLCFQRDFSGNFMYIKNKTKLKQDWEKWKITDINNFFKERVEKEKFILNYEKGMKDIDKMVSTSFQNTILLPPLYGFKSYQHPENYFTTQSISSKLFPNLIIEYLMYATHIEVNNVDEVKIFLKSKLSNTQKIKIFFNDFHKNLSDVYINNYQWGIFLDYILERSTGKVLKADFSLTEILHKNLRYDLKINLEEIKI